MLVHSIIFIILVLYQCETQSTEDVKEAIIKVRRFLLRATKRTTNADIEWLPNSGKIGAGYDLVTGSPVCYSGQCQMEGFRQLLFKLNITKRTEGSCTNKLIPQHVNLDCLSSTQITANTESISTVDQLMESTKRGIDVSFSVGTSFVFFSSSFSYSRSHETRSMIDTMVETNSTIYFTQATISWVRLSAFALFLELSDEFRYVIDNMPCCNQSDEIDEYIKEFIIDYFGIMYVKDLLLGGIAQQKIVISEEQRKKLETNGFTTSNEVEFKVAAGSIFSMSAKVGVTEQFDQTKLNTFKKFSQQSSITTLGGAPTMQSIEEWSKTIPANPTIIKFGVAPIIDLLTTRRFPHDPNITLKRDLIRRAQENYMGNQLFCYKNCSQHGSCVPTKYFAFGQCRCNPGWSGFDCSVTTAGPVSVNLIPVYRYNSFGVYFYTTSADEIGTTTIGSIGKERYVFEGIAFNLSATHQPNTVPFYRYGSHSHLHFYTTNWREIGTNAPGVIVNNWKMEGIMGYVYKTKEPGTCPLYRYFRPGTHLYTVDPCELGVTNPGAIVAQNFKYEGIAAYVFTDFPCNTTVCE